MLTSGTPQIVPLFVPKDNPAGKLALMAHEVISPGPVREGDSGRSVLTSPRTRVTFADAYITLVGNRSMTVMLR